MRIQGVAIAFVLVPCLALAQDAPKTKKKKKRYPLRASFTAKAGDKVRGLYSTKSMMLLNVKRRGKPLRVENRTSGREIRFEDEVIESSPQRLEILRTYRYVKDHETGRIDRTTTQVTMAWGQKGFDYKTKKKGAEIPPVAKELLDYEKKRPSGLWDYIIPGKPIPVGGRWKIPSDRVAQLWLLDPKDMIVEDSVCRGKLKSLVKKQGEKMLRLVFNFDLVFTKLWDVECVEPAHVGFTMDLYVSPNGATPRSLSNAVGEITGEGRLDHPDVPKDVTVEWILTIEGKSEYIPMRGNF